MSRQDDCGNGRQPWGRWHAPYGTVVLLVVLGLQLWLVHGVAVSVAQVTCPHDGNVDGEDGLTPRDVVLALQHYLGTADPALTPCQQDRANVVDPESTGVTPADSQCILQGFLERPSCLDNAPPVLQVVGQRTVMLGNAASLQITTTDPDGDVVRLSVAPLPLPDNAGFDPFTGSFTFRPGADQVADSPFMFTFAASDGGERVTEVVTITVLPGDGDTALRGIVLTTDNVALPGVRLEVAGTETVSDEDGTFVLSGLSPGAQRLLIDGSTVTPALGTFATVPEVVRLIAGTVNVLPAPIFLLPLDVASADPIDPTRESSIISSPIVVNGETFAAVELTVPAGTARDEVSGELFAGDVHISQIPAPTLGPMPLPADIDLSVYIAVQPFGVRYDPPVPIAFPNVDGFPVGAIVDIFGLNHDTGVFEKVGEGAVVRTAEGTMVQSIGGVVRSNSWHGFVPQPPLGEGDPGDVPRCPRDCRQSVSSSSVDPRTGDLSVEHSLVPYRSMQRRRALRFEYHSSTASPNPLVSLLVTTGNLTPPPLFMATTVALGGVQQGRVVTEGPPFCRAANCPFARQALTIDAADLATGIYPASVRVDCQFSVARRSRTFTQDVVVLNGRQSPFGIGWDVQGVPRLHPTATGELLLTQGDDTALVFSPAIRATATISASGERDLYHFSANGGEVVTIDLRRRSNQPDGSGTLDPLLELRTSQGIVVAREDSNGFPAPSGPGNNARINSLELPATDTYTIVALGQGGSRGPYELALVASGGSLLVAEPVQPGDAAPVIDAVVMSPAGDFSTLQSNVDGSFTRRLKDGTIFTFNAQGLVTSSADRNRNLTQYIYDAQDRLSAVIDPMGLQTTLRYTNGLLTTIEDPAGRITRFSHDNTGNLIMIIDPDGTTRRFTYDANHLMDSQTDKRGLVTRYEYDFTGRLTRTMRPDGSALSLVANQTLGVLDPASGLGTVDNPAPLFPAAGLQSTFTDGVGQTTVVQQIDALGHPTLLSDALQRPLDIRRDVNGLPTRLVTPNGAVMEISYDNRGNATTVRQAVGVPEERQSRFEFEPTFNQVTRMTDPLGQIWTFDYDTQGNLTMLTNPLGDVRTLTYDNRGLLLSVTDENGNRSRFTYDEVAANLATATDELGPRLTFSRDAAGNLVAVTERAGSPVERTTALTYDALNRPLTLTDGTGARTQVGYDAMGNIVAITSPTGEVVMLTYDALQRQTQIADPVLGVVQLDYDADGNIIRLMEGANVVSTFDYDALGRLLRSTDGLGGEHVYTYDSQGNLASFQDPKRQTTTYDYDLLNRRISRTNPLGQTTTFTYDARDHLLTRTDALNQVTTYTYDALARLTRIVTADNMTTFAYDAVGNYTMVQDDDSALRFTYDAVDRLVQLETLDLGHQPATTLTYTYDAVGNRTQLADTHGGMLQYRYDAADRLTRLTTTSGDAINLRYNAVGRLLEKRFPNGITTSYSYTAQGRLDEFIRRNASDTIIASTRNTYDILGHVLTMEELMGTRSFAYDALQRVSAGGTMTAPETYTYDATGNRLMSFLSASHRYDTANRLLEDDDFTYTYDANGNLLTRTAKDSGGTTQYTYDARNRLAQIAFPNETTARYRYDALGRRIEKDVDGAITRYVYDGLLAIFLEFDGSNTLVGRYAHGDSIDQPLSLQRGAEHFFLHADDLGSIRQLTNAAGMVVNSYEYDSYGRLQRVNEGVDNLFTYTGRERDAESDLYYYRTRYYDPQTGRFLTEDPLGLGAGGANLYRYVEDNPMNFVDPSGRVDIFARTSDVLNVTGALFELTEIRELERIVELNRTALLRLAGQLPQSEALVLRSREWSRAMRAAQTTERTLQGAKNFNTALAIVGGIASGLSERARLKRPCEELTVGEEAQAVGVGAVNVAVGLNPYTAAGSAVSSAVDSGFEYAGLQRPGVFEVFNNAGRAAGVTVDLVRGDDRSLNRLANQMRSGQLGSVTQAYASVGDAVGEFIGNLIYGP